MDPATGIDVLLSTPDVEHVVSDGADWFVAGVPHAALRALVETAPDIDAVRRPRAALSRRSLGPKYLLKALLERRLPDYPTERPKGAGAVPTERHFTDGPLADAFGRYDLPSVVPRTEREGVMNGDVPVAWNLLTYAVWRDRVLQNLDVAPVPGTRAYSWSLRAPV